MSHCSKNGCDSDTCDGNCKDKATTASRIRDLRDCDEWRCVCGSTCAGGASMCGSCKTPKVVGDCAKFGVHFNAERKASDMSPGDVEAASGFYKAEEITFPEAYSWIPYIDPATGAVRPGYVGLELGALLVSHHFCLSFIGDTTAADPGTPVPIIRYAIAGERIACADGSWVRVMDTPNFAAPTPPVMAGRTACPPVCPPPPCACTPARGGEFVLVQVDPLVTILRGGRLFITRCDWLAAVDNTIKPLNGRMRVAPILPRVIPGSIQPF
jgi:hypothetical protein